ncbi:uncharacterized mitochondrial protein AtMg00810-like [Ricinus communis]|uniref:uncharacterized mitochondrial protein AtMg00810-like n=1 Tax=Ricinus communis TaxID=3988 RepID=UPI00201A4CE0|nr:uncharacterized mitochondrial protein AtMg00810-like [Ricinus communis]
MDVKNSFLNEDLHKEVYMVPPLGLDHDSEDCKLRKALYGLKQALRAWFEKFTTVITSLGFYPSNHDSALIGPNDLGPLRYFLSIEVASSPKGYLLSQSKYISDIFKRARLSNNKTVDTPIALNDRYSTSDGSPLPDLSLYRTIVGSLVYLTITRPDIAYAVHIVSQFVISPTTVHWAAVLHILRYLRDTQFKTLLFSSTSSLELCAYSDADWAGDPIDRKSTTGFCIFLSDSLISWKSKKQDIISRSSMEVEYRAMASTTCVIVWLQWLLADMGVFLRNRFIYIVIIRVLFRLHTIRSFMNGPSISKSTVILPVIIFKMAP